MLSDPLVLADSGLCEGPLLAGISALFGLCATEWSLLVLDRLKREDKIVCSAGTILQCVQRCVQIQGYTT